MSNYTVRVKTSYINSRWFETQRQCAEWLGIVNSSKKAIQSRCKKFNYEVEFDN